MSKKSSKSSPKTAPTQEIVIEEETASSAPIAPTMPVNVPTGKLTAEERKALTPEQRKARREARLASRASVGVRLTRLVMRMSRRADRLSALFGSQTDGGDLVEMAIAADALREVAAKMAQLPADWKPRGKAMPGEARQPKAKVGDTFKLHPKRADRFEGLIDLGEELRLAVISKNGKMGVFRTEGGVSLTVPFNSVVRFEESNA